MTIGRSQRQLLRAPPSVSIPFLLLLVWIFFEYGRPPMMLGIPLMISGVAAMAWLATPDKQWSRATLLWPALLLVVLIGVPLAANNYWAFWTAKGMAVLFLCICLPLQALTNSVSRLRLWILVFVVVATYVATWAALHHGYGPAGTDGHDENYVAALSCTGFGLAYFAAFAERSRAWRWILRGSLVAFVASIALAANPSRGGFIGLCAVGAYCLKRSPRKMVGATVLAIAVIALLVLAGPTFWNEIRTTTDYQTGTGDIRLEIWKAGLRMWKANPLIGVGGGNFRWVIQDYQSAEQFAKFGRSLGGSIVAHSLWIEMLAELGSLGAILTGLLTWNTWSGLRRVRDDVSRNRPRATGDLLALASYADAIRAAILAVLVNGLFLSLYYYSHLWVLLALGSALPFIYRRSHGTVTAAPQPVRANSPRRGAPTLESMTEPNGPVNGTPVPTLMRDA